MGVRNIFEIAASDICAEDKFTAALTYLIANVPEVGQAMADLIVKGSGLPTPSFESAEDHPDGDSESKPDFLLHCKQFDILCEHKLDSSLGKRQLERYLDLRKDGRTRVALITNWDTPEDIGDDVLNRSEYLRPIASKVPYFSWQALYPLIASRPEQLAKEFAAYMQALGMAPVQLPGNWDTLFEDPVAAAAFQETTKALKNHFKAPGTICKKDSSNLAVQIQRPTSWLHLLYIYVSKTTKPFAHGISSPFIAARIFMRKDDVLRLARFRGRKDTLRTKHGLILGRQVKEAVSWNKELELAYEYVGSLNDYLTDDASETGSNLLDFGRTAFEHASEVVQ
jgi:hypothetical protein